MTLGARKDLVNFFFRLKLDFDGVRALGEFEAESTLATTTFLWQILNILTGLS